MADRETRTAAPENAELRRLRRRIDALDRRIVALLKERAELGRAVGLELLDKGAAEIIARTRPDEH